MARAELDPITGVWSLERPAGPGPRGRAPGQAFRDMAEFRRSTSQGLSISRRTSKIGERWAPPPLGGAQLIPKTHHYTYMLPRRIWAF